MYLVLIYIFTIFILLIYDKKIEGQTGTNDTNINIKIKSKNNTNILNVKLSDTIEDIKTIINGSWSNIGIPLNRMELKYKKTILKNYNDLKYYLPNII